MGSLAQVVVADESVEIHGRAGADGGGEVGHLGQHAEVVLDVADGGVSGFEGGRFGHVHEDLEFVFVVEREHLEGHAAGLDEQEGEEEEHAGAGEHEFGVAAGFGERPHGGVVDPVGKGLAGILRFLRGVAGEVVFQQFAGDPGGDGEGHQHGRQHGEGNIEGHGPHVGAHHAADEEQGNERRDHGQRGEDHRGHDLVHGHADGLEAGHAF